MNYCEHDLILVMFDSVILWEIKIEYAQNYCRTVKEKGIQCTAFENRLFRKKKKKKKRRAKFL